LREGREITFSIRSFAFLNRIMALVYSLKYKKLNFFQKVLLEKEGEMVIDRQSFRLKGKGGQDTGENIYFDDIMDISMKDDELSFTTLKKEKYILTGFANLFDSFLKDFMKVRNEYLAESLFMKVGMLYHEYEGNAEITNTFGKVTNKGKSRIQFYDGSIVVIPESREVFVIYIDFLKAHEFDDDEYVLRLFLDSGNTVVISKLGTAFEDVQQTFESLLGSMYEKVINYLKEVLPEMDAATLLKLAYKLKNGRSIPFNSMKKMDDNMQSRLMDLAFSGNALMLAKCTYLRKLAGDENFYLGFSFLNRHDTHEQIMKSWFICVIPDKNMIALGVTSSNENNIYFFRIVMQKGEVKEKMPAKLMEVEQFMVLFKGDFSAVCKDKKELRKSRYKTALKKLSFFRLLRKSFMIKNSASDEKKFKEDLDVVFVKAQDQVAQ
jgi:hypothetical protein